MYVYSAFKYDVWLLVSLRERERASERVFVRFPGEMVFDLCDVITYYS